VTRVTEESAEIFDDFTGSGGRRDPKRAEKPLTTEEREASSLAAPLDLGQSLAIGGFAIERSVLASPCGGLIFSVAGEKA